MNRKKLLIVATLPPPVHGSNIMNQYVADNTGLHEVFEIVVFPLRYASSIDDIGRIRLGKYLVLIRYLYRLLVTLFSFKPEFVYFVPAVTGLSFYRDCLFALLFKLFRGKIIYHLHGKGINLVAEKPIPRLIYRWFFQGSYIIQLSPLLFRDIEGIVEKAQVYFLPNGISLDGYEKSKDKSKDKDDVITFLYLSNLVVSKGPLDLLKAYRLLKNRGYIFRAIFVGAVSSELTEDKLNYIVHNFALDGYVEFLGPQYGYEKEKIFSKVNIFVLPTKADCFPLVILEAMAHGLPVVSTFEGAIPEIVQHGKTGYLVEKENPVALADAMETLLKDPVLCVELGSKAQEKVFSCYSIDKFQENLKMILMKIAGIDE